MTRRMEKIVCIVWQVGAFQLKSKLCRQFRWCLFVLPVQVSLPLKGRCVAHYPYSIQTSSTIEGIVSLLFGQVLSRLTLDLYEYKYDYSPLLIHTSPLIDPVNDAPFPPPALSSTCMNEHAFPFPSSLDILVVTSECPRQSARNCKRIISSCPDLGRHWSSRKSTHCNFWSGGPHEH